MTTRMSKVLVFSEWERMLRTGAGALRAARGSGTPGTPARYRRSDGGRRSRLFKKDPECRVFLSTDSGGTGLNLQNASVVINCDLPWNPARLEQRIARAWRKHQSAPVTVINSFREHHRTSHAGDAGHRSRRSLMACSILKGSLDEIQFRGGRQQICALAATGWFAAGGPSASARTESSAGRPRIGFAANEPPRSSADALLRCEEHYPAGGRPLGADYGG